jgi:transcriptional regulator with XRE-family HTH domain
MAEEAVRSLAGRLRERREELGLSQSQAARELDVARTAYRLWEMEAARPSPDRWRLIARWLGVSVTTMLLAEELLSEEESRSAPSAVAEIDRWANDSRDEPRSSPDEFYQRSDAVLAKGMSQGTISRRDAEALSALLRRIETQAPSDATAAWTRADLRKTLPLDVDAPSAARAALRVTASDVPAAALADATILVSEVVASAVVSSEGSSADTVALVVEVTHEKLRVEATVALPDGRAGLTMVDAVTVLSAIATRWGTTRESDNRYVVWFEMNLPVPGADGGIRAP